MMRIRGVWTTNLAAFLLGAGLYSSFLLYPQFAQLPRSTGFGFGASIVDSGLYLLPGALAMGVLGSTAGRVARRWGSKFALIVGTAITAGSFGLFAAAHSGPSEMVVSNALLGIGMGLAFAALGTLIVGAVPPGQTGAASGMNTVMRTLGGALGGQIAATLIANNVLHGRPTVTGFTDSFVMATAFLVVCVLSGLLVPGGRPALIQGRSLDSQLSPAEERV
jgi:MFS family permease